MAKNPDPIGVLFVCTGNICRSPTAEAVFRHHVAKAGLEHRFRIDSAGTHGYHIGDPPDHRAIATALAKGVDMRDLRARRFDAVDYNEFHYVLAMDASHHAFLGRLGGKGVLGMFMAGDVPDPYYGGQADFDLVYRLVDEGCGRWLSLIREKHGF